MKSQPIIVAGLLAVCLSANAQQSTLGAGGTAGANTAANVINGYSTNTYGAVNYGFSMNLGNTPNLQRALTNINRAAHIMFLGDSTGGDSANAIISMFSSNYLYGISPVLEFQGLSGYFPSSRTLGFFQSNAVPDYVGSVFVVSNGSQGTFGITLTQPQVGNSIRFTYIATNTTGTILIYTSPSTASNTWTLIDTTDTTTGPAGIRVTNIALASTTNIYLKVSNSVPGTEGRSYFIWPQIRSTTGRKVEFLDSHVGGITLGNFMAMGTNNIAQLLTNFAPDIIFYQQKKSVASMDYWTNVAVMFNTFATNSDVVVIQSYPSATSESDPANGSQFQLPVQRDVAKSNNWVFIDMVTPFPWTNVVQRFGLNDGDGIHLNGQGVAILGSMVAQQLNLPQMIANAGAVSYLSRTALGEQGMQSSLDATGYVASVGASAALIGGNQGAADSFRLYRTGVNPATTHWDGNGDGLDLIKFINPFGSAFIIASDYTFVNTATDPQLFTPTNRFRIYGTNSVLGGTNYFDGNIILKSNAYQTLNFTNVLGVGDMWFWNSNGSSLYVICKSISGVVKTQQVFAPF